MEEALQHRQIHIGENTEASNYEMGSGNNRTTIKRVDSEKDLGVFIDEKLNFREHITKKVNMKWDQVTIELQSKESNLRRIWEYSLTRNLTL